jgi:hypothetical protein
MKVLFKIIFLTIFLISSGNLFAGEEASVDKNDLQKEEFTKIKNIDKGRKKTVGFFYLGLAPSFYRFNNNFKRYLGVNKPGTGFYLEVGLGGRKQGDNVYIGSEHTLYMDMSGTGKPEEKLRDDYRELFLIGGNYRYALTFGRGNLMDPLFLPFAGFSIGWHWVASGVNPDYGRGYESDTDIGFGLFGGLEVKIYKTHKINVIFDYKPFYFKTFQAPSYKMTQYGILTAYKVFFPKRQE